MAQTEKKTWWNRIGDILQAKELYMLSSSTGIASSIALWIGRRLPPGYDAQDKLLAGLAAFTISGFLVVVLIRAGIKFAPDAERWWRRSFCEPPQIRATVFDGETAVLEILNEGGTAVFSSTGQIVAAAPAERHHEAVHINRQDSYPMIWRSDFEPRALIIVQGTKLRQGRSAKLIVGGFAVVNNYTVLRILGGDYKADQFRFDHHLMDSPTITIDVRITTEPPLRTAFVRRYQLVVRRQTGIVTLRELAIEETRHL